MASVFLLVVGMDVRIAVAGGDAPARGGAACWLVVAVAETDIPEALSFCERPACTAAVAFADDSMEDMEADMTPTAGRTEVLAFAVVGCRRAGSACKHSWAAADPVG